MWGGSFVAEALALEVVGKREEVGEGSGGKGGGMAQLREVCERSRVVIQWVPGHVGVEGNEWADREANNARGMSQEGVGIGFA